MLTISVKTLLSEDIMYVCVAGRCLNFIMKPNNMKQFWVIYHKLLFIPITISSLRSNFKDVPIYAAPNVFA